MFSVLESLTWHFSVLAKFSSLITPIKGLSHFCHNRGNHKGFSTIVLVFSTCKGFTFHCTIFQYLQVRTYHRTIFLYLQKSRPSLLYSPVFDLQLLIPLRNLHIDIFLEKITDTPVYPQGPTHSDTTCHGGCFLTLCGA